MSYSRILALDVGESRIGVAVSDLLRITAQGVGVIKRGNNLDKDIDRIIKYASDYEAKKIVVGNPINLDGTKGKRAELNEEFYEYLKEKTDIDLMLWDERFSTKQAERALEEAGVNWRKKREVIDMMAAQIILQSYLDYLSIKGE